MIFCDQKLDFDIFPLKGILCLVTLPVHSTQICIVFCLLQLRSNFSEGCNVKIISFNVSYNQTVDLKYFSLTCSHPKGLTQYSSETTAFSITD